MRRVQEAEAQAAQQVCSTSLRGISNSGEVARHVQCPTVGTLQYALSRPPYTAHHASKHVSAYVGWRMHLQAAKVVCSGPALHTERTRHEGRSVDPVSPAMISVDAAVPLSAGSVVVTQGLKGAPQHSGKEGRLIELLPDEHRWVVQLVGEEQPFKIKEENLALSPTGRRAVSTEGLADESANRETTLQITEDAVEEKEVLSQTCIG